MLKGHRIALVEDDEIMGGSLAQRLALEGAEVLWLKQATRALGALRTPRKPFDAVICDIRLPDGSGEAMFTALCRTVTPPPFLFITGQGDIAQAVRLMQAGAADYVTKPFELPVLLERLALLIRRESPMAMPPLLGISEAARRVEALVQAAAAQDHPVTIRGAPGTGKGLVARRIHRLSDRRAAPFVEVNLARESDPAAALDEALRRTGEGVLFLNAPERLPEPAQDDLLRALDRTSGRVVSAMLPGAGLPLAALLDRLSRSEIRVPPLADRPEDAVWLLRRLFERMNPRRPQPLSGLSALAEAAVRAHDWPGNGRELRARLVRALESAAGDRLFPADLFPERQDAAFRTLAEAREAAERAQILAALDRCEGRVAEAAKLLDVSRTTLWEKMQKLGLRRSEIRTLEIRQPEQQLAAARKRCPERRRVAHGPVILPAGLWEETFP